MVFHELNIAYFFIIDIGDDMFYNHNILNVNDEEVLYLYVSNMYEFSIGFDKTNKIKSLYNKISEYIKDMDINFNGKKVMLVVNGIIIGSLMLLSNNFSDTSKNNGYISYKEITDIDINDHMDVIDINSKMNNFIKDKLDQNDPIVSNFVKMKNKDGMITYVDINNYIINTTSKIIPPTYEDEALKSAVIICRTKMLQDLYENNYLNQDDYVNTSNLQKLWKKDFNFYYNKLKDAVQETNNEYLLKNNYYFKFNDREKYQIPFTSYGANILAKNGYTYIDILGHYYPDATLETV